VQVAGDDGQIVREGHSGNIWDNVSPFLYVPIPEEILGGGAVATRTAAGADAGVGGTAGATEAMPAAPNAASTEPNPLAESTGNSSANPEDDGYDWKLGDYKSAQRWQNQMNSREWTLEEIDNTISTGEQTPAPNNINKGNPAVRYTNPETGRYVVRDETTKEILQISGKRYIPSD